MPVTSSCSDMKSDGCVGEHIKISVTVCNQVGAARRSLILTGRGFI